MPETDEELLSDVPGFGPIPSPDLDESPEDPTTEPPMSSPTSTLRLPPDPGSGAASPTGPSSRGSSDRDPVRAISDEAAQIVEDGAGDMAGAAFQTIGIILNRRENMRRAARGRPQTDLWLPTEDEVLGLGEALGRIGERHIPDEVKQGDGADMIQIAGVALTYLARNALGVSASEFDAAAAGAPRPQGPPQVPTTPQGPPQAPPPVPARPASVSVQPDDLAPAETGPAVSIPIDL
jgi:hypothetical protein